MLCEEDGAPSGLEEQTPSPEESQTVDWCVGVRGHRAARVIKRKQERRRNQFAS